MNLLKEYKDYLLYCYDHDIISPDEFFVKLRYIQKLEKYVK